MSLIKIFWRVRTDETRAAIENVVVEKRFAVLNSYLSLETHGLRTALWSWAGTRRSTISDLLTYLLPCFLSEKLSFIATHWQRDRWTLVSRHTDLNALQTNCGRPGNSCRLKRTCLECSTNYAAGQLLWERRTYSRMQLAVQMWNPCCYNHQNWTALTPHMSC